MKATGSRKRFNDRQLLLNFQPVEHTVSGASKLSDGVESKRINPFSRRNGMFHTVTVEALADKVQADDRLRLLEPTSLPKQLRGWSPRPRPKTAIISYAAQRAYERRCVGESNQQIVRKFLGQRNNELRRMAARLKAGRSA